MRYFISIRHAIVVAFFNTEYNYFGLLVVVRLSSGCCCTTVTSLLCWGSMFNQPMLQRKQSWMGQVYPRNSLSVCRPMPVWLRAKVQLLRPWCFHILAESLFLFLNLLTMHLSIDQCFDGENRFQHRTRYYLSYQWPICGLHPRDWSSVLLFCCYCYFAVCTLQFFVLIPVCCRSEFAYSIV